MRLKFLAIFCLGVTLGWVLRPIVLIPVEKAKQHVIVEPEIEQVITKLDPQTPRSQAIAPVPVNPLQSSRSLLQQQKYNDVIQLLRSLERSNDKIFYQQIKASFFTEVANLFNKQRYERAADLINAYLAYYFNDDQALIWLGRIQIATGHFKKGIKSLYAAKAYIIDHLQLNNIEQQIYNVIEQHAGELLKKKAWQELVALYQFLIGLAPDVPFYYVGLATSQIQLNDWYNAQQTLEIIRNDTRVTVEVGALFAKIEQHQREIILSESGIALKRRNGNYLVQVLLNNVLEITLLIDTGASMSSLTPEVLAQVGLSAATFNRRRIRVNTANGQVEVPVLNVDQLSISEFSVDDLAVIVLPMKNMPEVDGLLGMNYLRHFEFIIDQNKDLLYLKKTLNRE